MSVTWNMQVKRQWIPKEFWDFFVTIYQQHTWEPSGHCFPDSQIRAPFSSLKLPWQFCSEKGSSYWQWLDISEFLQHSETMLTSPSLLAYHVYFYECRDHKQSNRGEQEATNPILPMVPPGQVKAEAWMKHIYPNANCLAILLVIKGLWEVLIWR